MGTINVVATNIELNFSFSPIQAAKNSMKQSAQADDGYDQQQAPAQGPPPMCPPRFCSAHDSSDKRVKGDPCFKDCKSCGIRLQSSYKDFQLCPPCSEEEQKCMICGTHAPNSSAHMLGATQGGPQDKPQAPTRGYAKHAAPPPRPAKQHPWDT